MEAPLQKKLLGFLGFGPLNLFVFLVGYNLQWETPGVVFSMVDCTLAQFVVRLLCIGPAKEIPNCWVTLLRSDQDLWILNYVLTFSHVFLPQFLFQPPLWFSFPLLYPPFGGSHMITKYSTLVVGPTIFRV